MRRTIIGKIKNVITGISAPTTQATNLSFPSVGPSNILTNWTSGNGTKRILVVKTSAFSGSDIPTDDTVYTANSTYGSGDTISGGGFVVYNNNGSAVSVVGLSPMTLYHFKVFEYNEDGGTIKYNVNNSTNNPRSQSTL